MVDRVFLASLDFCAPRYLRARSYRILLNPRELYARLQTQSCRSSLAGHLHCYEHGQLGEVRIVALELAEIFYHPRHLPVLTMCTQLVCLGMSIMCEVDGKHVCGIFPTFRYMEAGIIVFNMKVAVISDTEPIAVPASPARRQMLA